jgi:hypothetical protein
VSIKYGKALEKWKFLELGFMGKELDFRRSLGRMMGSVFGRRLEGSWDFFFWDGDLVGFFGFG